MDILLALTTATQALGLAKELRDIDKGVEFGEVQAKMADLYVAVSDMKIALADAKIELREKDLEIEHLKKMIGGKKELIEVNGFKFDKSPEINEPTGYAYCPHCEVEHGKLFRLVDNLLPKRTNCNKCRSTFNEEHTLKR